MGEKFPKVEPTLEAIDKFIEGHYASCFDVLEHFRFARQRIADLEASADSLRAQRDEAVAHLRCMVDAAQPQAHGLYDDERRDAEAFLARYDEPSGKGEG